MIGLRGGRSLRQVRLRTSSWCRVTFIHDPDLKPVATSLYAFASRFDRDWALTNAASVLMLAPAVILFLIFQRQFIQGMTQGRKGLKRRSGRQAAMMRAPYFGMFRSRVTRIRPSAWAWATRRRSNGSRWCIGSAAACSAWW